MPTLPILKFHTIQISFADVVPPGLSEHVERHAVFLSADLRACAQEKSLLLSDRALAQELLTAIGARLSKRYGDQARFGIATVEASASAHLLRRVEIETARIRARIDQQVFAPNKRPVGL